MEGLTVELRWSGDSWRLDAARAAVMNGAALELSGAPVERVVWRSVEDPLPAREAVEGKVVVLSAPRAARDGRRSERQLAALGPAVLIAPGPAFRPRTMLEERQPPAGRRTPMVLVADADFAKTVEAMDRPATATVRIPAPERQPVELKNVGRGAGGLGRAAPP